VLIEVIFKLPLFITELLCPSVVLVVVRNHKDTVIMILMGKKIFILQFKHPLNGQHKYVCWPSYVGHREGHFMLAVLW
jgi:hypothetical protein